MEIVIDNENESMDSSDSGNKLQKDTSSHNKINVVIYNVDKI